MRETMSAQHSESASFTVIGGRLQQVATRSKSRQGACDGDAMRFFNQMGWCIGRDRIVVSTSRCGRDNPGSNPGHGRAVFSVTA